MTGVLDGRPELRASDLLGRVIAGKMELLDVLGEGAMGCVFRARHRLLDKMVAIKVMKRAGDDAGRSARFAREAQTAARFDHPNSVRILDFGEDGEDKLLYLAMEFLDGRDLHRALHEDGPFGSRRLTEVMIQVVGALAGAHEKGVIHRDIKPANIMILERKNDDGESVELVKVCDFGLAKMLTPDLGATSFDGGPRTAVGVLLGTPMYMSPEQAVNENVDERSDVYACGIVMYEMLTGRVPFNAASYMAILIKHVSEAPVPPSKVAPGIDPELESIVMWTLEKQLERRCPSARELRRALKEYLAGMSLQPLTQPGLLTPASFTVMPSELLLAPLRPLQIGRGAPSSVAEALPDAAILGPGAPMILNVIDDARATNDIEAIVNEAASSDLALDEPLPPSLDAQVAVDRRRHGTEVSDRAQYIWLHHGIMYEPYLGSEPFWVRDHRQMVLGPCSYADALKLIQGEGRGGFAERVAISGDGRSWIDGVTFARLTGQEALLYGRVSQARARSSFSGNLDSTSLTALFARLARERGTGRMMFTREEDDSVAAELHIVRGKPTFVFSDDPGYQLPQLLAKRGLVNEALIPVLIHQVLREELPLEQIVERETQSELRAYRSALMRARLAHLFGLRKANFAFATDLLPASNQPFCPSLLALLPELVHRHFTTENLRHYVGRYADARLPRSERLAGAAAEMGLNEHQNAMIKRLLKGPVLSEALRRTEPKEEKMLLSLAYILLEADLLLRPITS